MVSVIQASLFHHGRKPRPGFQPEEVGGREVECLGEALWSNERWHGPGDRPSTEE